MSSQYLYKIIGLLLLNGIQQFVYLRLLKKMKELRHRSRLLFHHDNASSHTGLKTVTFFKKSGIEILGHPPYSPDLAPCDFFLFRKIKDKLRGLSFNCSEEAVLSYERLISELPQDS